MIIKQLAKLNSTSRSAVFYSLVVIVAIAMHNWMIRPHLTYLRAVERLSPVIDTISQEKTNLQKQLEIRQTLVEKLSQEYTQSCEMLYTPEQVLQFESDMRTLATLAGCNILSIEELKSSGSRRADPGKTSEVIETHKSRVEVQGDYDALIAFLKRLQADFQGLGVNGLQINSGRSASEPLHCFFVLNLPVITDREALLDEQKTHN